MKTNFLYLLIIATHLFAGCKGRKTVEEKKPAANATSNVNVQRYLTSEFIDAKKYAILEENDKAKALFQKILEEDAKCDACAFEIAKIAILQNDARLAEEMSNKAYALDPSNKEYIKQNAEVLWRLGNYEMAAKRAKTLLDSFPKTRSFYREYVYYAQTAKLYDDAEKAINQYQTYFGYNKETSNLYEFLYEKSGNKEKQLANLKRLSARYPTEAEIQKKYISALVEGNDLISAKAAVAKLENGEQFLLMARINAIEKNWDDYCSNITLAVKDSTVPRNSILPYLIQEPSIKNETFTKALEKLANQEPKAFVTYQFYAGKGINTAAASTEKALYLADKNQTNGVNYFEALMKLNDWNTSELLAKELLETYPSYSENYSNYAKALMNNGKYADAYSYADQGLAYAIINAETIACYIQMARVNHYLKQPEKLKDHIEKAIPFAKKAEELESLIYLSVINTIQPLNIDKAEALLKKLNPNSYIFELKELIKSTPFDLEKWNALRNKNKDNIVVLEAMLIQASGASKVNTVRELKVYFNNLYPKHSFYQQL